MTDDNGAWRDGATPGQALRAALLRELARLTEVDGIVAARAEHIMRRLVDMAEGGNLRAIALVLERSDGRVPLPAAAARARPLPRIVYWTDYPPTASPSSTPTEPDPSFTRSTLEGSALPAS